MPAICHGTCEPGFKRHFHPFTFGLMVLPLGTHVVMVLTDRPAGPAQDFILHSFILTMFRLKATGNQKTSNIRGLGWVVREEGEREE